MAARKRKLTLSDDWKAKISASMIVKRLQDHIFGDALLEQSQVSAANILLKKVLPDLQATQHSGDPENPVRQDITVTIVDAND